MEILYKTSKMKKYLNEDDLMIGDIIRYADQTEPERATLQTLIDISKGAKVVGVEISKQNLEKFGFKNVPDGDIWCLLSTAIDFVPKGETESKECDKRLSTLCFFHEVQHVFRAIGVDYFFDPKYQHYK